jgi:hypothetical protein
MISQTFIQGLRRLLNSSHVQASVAGLSAAFATAYFAAPGLPPAGKAALWISFMAAVGVVLRETINAITEENVASIQASAPAAAPATATSELKGYSLASGLSEQDAISAADVAIFNRVAEANQRSLDALQSPLRQNHNIAAASVPPRTTLPGMK